MTDHAPTTEEMREDFAVECDQAGNLLRSEDRAKLFDRWLADHDRKIEAKALWEFADTLGVNVGDEDDEWWRGYQQAQRECLHKVSDRADRIEQGGES